MAGLSKRRLTPAAFLVGAALLVCGVVFVGAAWTGPAPGAAVVNAARERLDAAAERVCGRAGKDATAEDVRARLDCLASELEMAETR